MSGHGVTLAMRALPGVESRAVHVHAYDGYRPYRGPSRDRALPGKRRIRARRAARRAAES